MNCLTMIRCGFRSFSVVREVYSLFVSGSDKQINIFRLLTGESIATLFGHSEFALGLCFLPDLRHLVTVSADSCIFVWRLSAALSNLVQDRRCLRSANPLSTLLSRRSASVLRRASGPNREEEGAARSPEDESVSFSAATTSSWLDSATEMDEDSEADVASVASVKDSPLRMMARDDKALATEVIPPSDPQYVLQSVCVCVVVLE